MRFQDLNEADIANFADHAGDALDRIGSLASKAYGRLKDRHEKIQSNNKKADAEAKKTAVIAAKANKAKVDPASAPATVARIVLDRTPNDPEDLEELAGLNADEFQNVQNACDQVQSRLEKFSKRLAIDIAKSDLVNAQERDEVVDRLQDQNDRVLESSETMLMQDKNGEHDAWVIALTNDDSAIGTKALIRVIRNISAANQKKNLALMTNKQARKVYPEGLNLLNMLGAQRQVLEMRLGLLKAALIKMESSTVKPITTEQLKRIRKLVKRL